MLGFLNIYVDKILTENNSVEFYVELKKGKVDEDDLDKRIQLYVERKREDIEEFIDFIYEDNFINSPEYNKVCNKLIRDHDRSKFEEKKQRIKDICSKIVSENNGCQIECEVKDSYYNMYEKICPDSMHIVKRATDAMESLGVEPIIEPVRGGTDGAMLSFKGLPCPNICAGGHNFHGVYEYICVESMDKIAEILVKIVTG